MNDFNEFETYDDSDNLPQIDDDVVGSMHIVDETDEADADDTVSAKIEKPDLETTLAALRESDDSHVNTTIVYGLSNLTAAEIATLAPVWHDLAPAYRRKLMRRLVDVSEANYELNYRALAYFTLADSDPGVRAITIELLFEDYALTLMDRLIEMAQFDENRDVRAAAVSALGRFILAGELGDLDEADTVRAQDAAANLYNNLSEDVEVRRRALEAIANCSHEIVDDAINEAYASHDRRMRVSALFAMGRSCDEQWAPIIVRELDSEDPEMRYEAARAAGEVEAPDAVPLLVRLALENDREIKEVAIWSLGEIGGTDAVRTLNKLARFAAEADDEDLIEAVDEALANANLVNGDLFDFDQREL